MYYFFVAVAVAVVFLFNLTCSDMISLALSLVRYLFNLLLKLHINSSTALPHFDEHSLYSLLFLFRLIRCVRIRIDNITFSLMCIYTVCLCVVCLFLFICSFILIPIENLFPFCYCCRSVAVAIVVVVVVVVVNMLFFMYIYVCLFVCVFMLNC